MIAPAHVQQQFAAHGLQLARFAKSPQLCDRRSCAGLEYWGGKLVFLAASARTDFVVVVFPTIAEARRVGGLSRPTEPLVAERRSNLVLFYLRSAKVRLAIVRRIFSSS